MQADETKATAAMVILPCSECGRSVKVLGRVRRVLCACGQILLEVVGEGAMNGRAPSGTAVLEARRA
jgi:hypothetical protein